jgi:hypothetical protein
MPKRKRKVKKKIRKKVKNLVFAGHEDNPLCAHWAATSMLNSAETAAITAEMMKAGISRGQVLTLLDSSQAMWRRAGLLASETQSNKGV